MQAIMNTKPVEFTDGETILEVARREKVFIPTLCEFVALNHRPGTCRMCLVEVLKKDGSKAIVTACDTRLQEGDVVETRTHRVRSMRSLQAELLFADHCEKCSGCARHGNCELQDVAAQVGLDLSKLSGRLCTRPPKADDSAPGLVYTPDKCIRCLRCVEMCRSIHGIAAITLNQVGTNACIGFDDGKWGESDRCIQCGQCALVCPTGALAVKDQCCRAFDYFADPDIVTVVQFAPAVRISIAEFVGAKPGTDFEGRVVAALKRLGADFVMDTSWSADVTIMEEGTELLERLRYQKNEGRLDHPATMFTSCCPGWVNHIEKSAPDMIPNLSTTRSPQAIFGALAKHYLPNVTGVPAGKIRQISIMPCTAKKDEAGRDLLKHNGKNDVDLVLTIQEFVRILERSGIDLNDLEPEPFDSPFMSQASGGAKLFATTGGVMEAAMRTVNALAGGKGFSNLAFEPVRGLDKVKEASLETEAFGTLRVAVVYGIRAADAVIERVRSGNAPWHFVEVMACPGGCIGGGGTLRGKKWSGTLPQRQQGVYRKDADAPIRGSHENPDVIRLYRDFLIEPGSHLAHELLHCTYTNRKKSRKPMRIFELSSKVKLAKNT